MDASPNLKVISKHGAGIDTIDSAAAAVRGIRVKAAIGANAASVAEHTWALILACAKDIVHLNERTHHGHWDKAIHKSLELRGKNLGLIGIGAIGKRTAQVGLAFGMRVLAYDPFAAKPPKGITLCDIDTVLKEAHILSLHCPLNDNNKNMINRESISKMRNGAILVNTARGGLVDEVALVDALASGKIHAVGLDSFQNEPIHGLHIFSDVQRAILTPHIGGVSSDAYVAMGVGAVQNVLVELGLSTV